MKEVRIIPKRWQCKFGLHKWERCIRKSMISPGEYEHCFACGKDRDL